MNFKVLYGWYVAIVVVMVLSVGLKISHVAKAFVEGFETAYSNVSESVEENDTLPVVWAGANIRIDSDSLKAAYSTVLKSGDKSSLVEIIPSTYTVMASGDPDNKGEIIALSVVQGLLAFLVLILSAVVFVFIAKLFICINSALKRREVSDLKVIRTMRVLGMILLAQSLVNMAFVWIQSEIGETILSGYDIDIVFADTLDYTRIVLAFVTIMISEVFKIGYNIREEQSLTI